MDRYITIKRKLSPQNYKSQQTENKSKITRDNANMLTNKTPENTNRFELLANSTDESIQPAKSPKKVKPPPIYIREKSSSALVNKIATLIGENSFYVIPLRKGNINETKVQTETEDSHRLLTKFLDEAGKNFYTYQLKSARGLQVVLKGIEATVSTTEIVEALKEKNFNAKMVMNILNKNKEPQPMFKIELEPERQTLKKNEVHPIYKLQLLLHRRITVEEPHKRNRPVQCTNCQEYGHTKAYCTLKSICVVCSEAHSTANCHKNKEDISVKKCSNCGESHTANWRGCVVYKELKNRLNKRGESIRAQTTHIAHTPPQPGPSSTAPPLHIVPVLASPSLVP